MYSEFLTFSEISHADGDMQSKCIETIEAAIGLKIYDIFNILRMLSNFSIDGMWSMLILTVLCNIATSLLLHESYHLCKP